MIDAVLFSVGVGVVATSSCFAASSVVKSKVSEYLTAQKFGLTKFNPDLKLALAGVLGFLVGVALTNGTPYMSIASLIFAGLGIGAETIVSRILRVRRIEKKRAECFLLFSAVEIFLQAGLSIPQALANSRGLMVHLEPAINRALATWSSGSVKALEALGQEIGLPEGDILVSLLLQVHQSGSQGLPNIIQNESHQLEERRRAVEKARITQKPAFLMAYRLLPFVVLLGLMAGVLVTRVFVQMNSIL